jgi:hypothetical protein
MIPTDVLLMRAKAAEDRVRVLEHNLESARLAIVALQQESESHRRRADQEAERKNHFIALYEKLYEEKVDEAFNSQTQAANSAPLGGSQENRG